MNAIPPRPLRFLALLALLAATGSTARAAEPGVFVEGRYYASTVGPVRWLSAHDEHLLVSDLRAAVAALDTATGRTTWTHNASGGRLDAVHLIGDRVVVVGQDLEVLDAGTGELLWARLLGCTEALCQSRVQLVDDAGVVVSGRGRVHNWLWRLSLTDGSQRWRQPLPVRHPREVVAAGAHMAVLEANAPFAVKGVDARTGELNWEWAWLDGGRPVVPRRIRVAPDGTVAAVRTRPPDGSLAQVTLVGPGPDGPVAVPLELATPEGVPSRATWADVVDRSLFVYVPDPKRGGAHLVRTTVGARGRVRHDFARRMDRPKTIAGRVVVHSHDGSRLQIRGYEGASGSTAWELAFPAPRRRATVLGDGTLALMILHDSHAPFVAIDAASGALVGVGSFPDGAPVTAFHRAGDTLFAATGRGVRAFRLASVAEIAARARKAFTAGQEDRLESELSSLELLAGRVAAVDALKREIAARRLERLRVAASRGDRRGALRRLAGLVAQPQGESAAKVAAWAAPVASLLADAWLASGRDLGAAEAASLSELATRLTALVRRHGEAFGSGQLRSHQGDLRGVVIVTTALAVRSGMASVAAELLRTWLEQPVDRVAGIEAMYGAVSRHALGELLALVRADLEGGDADKRAQAASLLGGFAHAAVALDSESWLADRLAPLADGSSPTPERDAKALARDLTARLKRLSFNGRERLGGPGCKLACRSLGEVCRKDGCRDPEACGRASARCVKRCKRKPWPTWSPPARRGGSCR